MSDRGFHAYFSSMTDEKLRELFKQTREEPSKIEVKYAVLWRRWLVDTVLEYFHSHPPHDTTDRLCYLAFTLRFLTAIDADSASSSDVREVLRVMVYRHDVTSVLLFGSIAVKRRALREAFGQAFSSNQALESYQETILQDLIRHFEKWKDSAGYIDIDLSTVYSWSRRHIPALELHILTKIRPARQVARGNMISSLLPSRAVHERGPMKESLVAYASQIIEKPLSIYHGIAVAVLNDYYRRVENSDNHFRSQRGWGIMLLPLGIVFGGALGTYLWPGVPEWMRLAARLVIALSGPSVAAITLSLFVQLSIETALRTEHVSRTRTDIQTLQQLLDTISEEQLQKARKRG